MGRVISNARDYDVALRELIDLRFERRSANGAAIARLESAIYDYVRQRQQVADVAATPAACGAVSPRREATAYRQG